MDEHQQDKILFLLGPNDYLVLESLIALLELDHPPLSESILKAVAVLVKSNGQAASRVQLTLCTFLPALCFCAERLETAPRHRLAVDLIIDRTTDSKDSMRLAAAVCATNLFKAIDTEREPLLHMMPLGNVRSILFVLLRLLGSSSKEHSTQAASALGKPFVTSPRPPPLNFTIKHTSSMTTKTCAGQLAKWASCPSWNDSSKMPVQLSMSHMSAKDKLWRLPS
jgi:hypothetical protein